MHAWSPEGLRIAGVEKGENNSEDVQYATLKMTGSDRFRRKIQQVHRGEEKEQDE